METTGSMLVIYSKHFYGTIIGPPSLSFRALHGREQKRLRQILQGCFCMDVEGFNHKGREVSPKEFFCLLELHGLTGILWCVHGSGRIVCPKP